MMNRNTKGKIDEIAELFVMSRSISSSMDLDLLLNVILQRTRHLVGASFCTLRLLDKFRRRLRLASYVGLDETRVKEISVLESDLAKKAMETEDPLVIDNVRDYFKDNLPSCLEKHNIKSIVIVPLFSYKRRVGALSVYISDGKSFDSEEIETLEIVANFCSMAIDNTGMLDRVKRDYLDTIKTLAKIIDANDSYTRGHCEKVTKYTLVICRELKLPARYTNAVKTASLLHDIGKIGIDLSIIRKPGKLTEEDWQKVRMHPEIGAKIVSQEGFLSEIVPIIRHHHERFGGGGYPSSDLKGKQIPLGARIIAVADAFDAMTSFRPYRDAMSRNEAIAELKRCSGTQFDPEVVDAFLKTQ